MQPRSRIRGLEPPPPPPPPPTSGGRYRRRSPPPPTSGGRYRRRSPPPPSQPQRRSPERPRRLEEKPSPPVVVGAGDRRSRADILLEAGRLAAHYLVAQGVLPEHVLHAREDPKHSNPSPRPELPAAARKRDDAYHDDDPRWRRNGSGGDWGRDKGDEDRLSLSRRTGWDRRTQSFDGRRKYNDGGGGGDVDRGGRRSHAYDDQRRPAMSRSYSHNDRRASSDDRRASNDVRLDRRRRSRSRSRSRSRTRTRSSYSGSRRNSDWRAGSGDLDRSKVPESRTVTGGDGDVEYDNADQVPTDPEAPRSVVVMEADDSASHEDEEMESEDHCGDEDGENAVASLNDADAGEINATQHQLSDVDVVHSSEPVEEPVHMQPQLSNGEGDMEAGIASLVEPVAENSGCSEVRDEMEAPQSEVEIDVGDLTGCSEVREEMEAPQSEVETDVGDLTRDEQELPAWYAIFDLNVTGNHEGCEMSEIPGEGDPPADHVSDSAPDLVGQMSKQAYYDTPETQGQDERADGNQQLEDGHVLINQGIGAYALNKNDLNSEQMLLNERADEHGQDNHQLEDEHMLLNNEETLLKQDANEHEDHTHQMENEQMPLNQGPDVQVLDNYHVNDEQLLLDHAADEHPDHNHRIKDEQMLLHHVTGVHDLDNYDLNSEQMLLNNGADKPAADRGQLKDRQMLLGQAADRQTTLHNLGFGRMIPVINLEDDYEEQSDTKEFLESKSDTLHMDNALPEHMCSQDERTSSFPDHPQTNIRAASSSLVTPNFGNRWTGRDAVNAQGIPSDDDVLWCI